MLVEGQSVFGRDKATHFMPLSSRLAQWERNKIHPLKVFSKPGTCSLYDFTQGRGCPKPQMVAPAYI
jgi:hypothetical protein